MVRKQQLDRSSKQAEIPKSTGTTAKLIEKTGRKLTRKAVDAARNRTTLGEISDALETVYGRYQIKSFSGVYSKEIKDDKSFEKQNK
jgi:methylmalonyl-CoA mutase